MVKRETIGKIQLTIGIILLLAGIIGGVLIYVAYNNFMGIFESRLLNLGEGNEAALSLIGMEWSTLLVIIMNLVTTFSLSIIISLLFITQGLVNLSKTNRRRW